MISSCLIEISGAGGPRDAQLRTLCSSYERWCKDQRTMAHNKLDFFGGTTDLYSPCWPCLVLQGKLAMICFGDRLGLAPKWPVFFQDAIDKTLSKAFLLQVVLLRSFLLPKSWRLEVPRTPPYPKRSWRGQLPDCLSLGYAVRWLHLMMAQFTTSSSTYKYWIVWQTFWCPKDVKVLMLRMAGQVQFLSNFGPPTIQGNGSLRAFHWLQCAQSLLNMGCSSKKGFTSNHVF